MASPKFKKVKQCFLILLILTTLNFGLIPIFIGINCIAQEEEIKEQKERTKPHFDFGGNISFGYGGVYNTGSIKKYYDRLQSEVDTFSFEKSISTTWGTVWGISGIVNFTLNDRIHFNTGVQFQSQKNNIELDETKDFSNNSFNKISSTARISTASIQIPLTARVLFLVGDKNPFEGLVYPYIKAGFSYEMRLSKTLDLNETITEYDATATPPPPQDKYNTTHNSFSKVKLDGYGNSAFNYIIAVGLDMILLEYDKTTFTIEISFSSNFGKEELWARNLPKSGKNPTNREIFDKSEAEKLNINDWKNSNIRMAIGLLF